MQKYTQIKRYKVLICNFAEGAGDDESKQAKLFPNDSHEGTEGICDKCRLLSDFIIFVKRQTGD